MFLKTMIPIRKILALIYLFSFFAIKCSGQWGTGIQEQALGNSKTVIHARGQLVSDSLFYLPYRDTTLKPVRAGGLVMNQSDNVIYYWDGVKYNAIGAGGSVTANYSSISAMRASSLYSLALPLYQTSGYYASGDGGMTQWYWDGASSVTDDGIFFVKPTAVSGAGRWRRAVAGRVDALQAGIKNDGTDQTSVLNTVLANSGVSEVVFSTGSFTINGTATATGKKLIFQNGAKLTGSGSLTGGTIECDPKKQCLAVNITTGTLENNIVYPGWTGAKADAIYLGPAPTDNLLPFNRLLYGMKTGGILHIPQGDSTLRGYYYNFSATWVVNRKIKIEGDNAQNTVLMFPETAHGIKVLSSGSDFKDFTLRGNFQNRSNNINADTAAGIWVAGNGNRFENIYVYNFDGDGFKVQGDVNYGSNANLNSFINVVCVFNGRAGMYFQGGDANQNIVINANCAENARWGIWDGSFLGNTFLNPHLASNPSDHALNKTVVSLGGSFYNCISDNIGIKPGVTSGWQTYWSTVAWYPSFSTVWDTTVQYYAGGGMLISDANAQSTVLGGYTEGDEWAGRSNGRSRIDGGFLSSQGSFADATGTLSGVFTTSNGLQDHVFASGGLSVKLQASLGFVGLERSSATLGWYNTDGFLTGGWWGIGRNSIPLGFTFGWNDWTQLKSRLGLDTVGGNSSMSYTLVNQLGIAWPSNSGAYRRLFFDISAPASGDYSNGDFIINAGQTSSTSLLGWTCITPSVHGTGAVWKAISVPTNVNDSLRTLQFTIGDLDTPNSGDSVLTHTSLIGKYLRIFRVGELQPLVSGVSQGYQFNQGTGQIIFHPALTLGEGIFIEARDTNKLITMSLQSNPAAGSYLSLGTPSGGTITESPAHTFTQTTGSPNVVANLSIPAGTAGELICDLVTSTSVVAIGLDGNNTTNAYYGSSSNWKYEFYSNDGTHLVSYAQGEVSAGTNTPITPSSNTRFKIRRDGLGTVTAQYSTDGGVNWTIARTFAGTYTGVLYAKFSFPVAANKLYNPKGVNFQ
jgi:hypothetical protein